MGCTGLNISSLPPSISSLLRPSPGRVIPQDNGCLLHCGVRLLLCMHSAAVLWGPGALPASAPLCFRLNQRASSGVAHRGVSLPFCIPCPAASLCFMNSGLVFIFLNRPVSSQTVSTLLHLPFNTAGNVATASPLADSPSIALQTLSSVPHMISTGLPSLSCLTFVN